MKVLMARQECWSWKTELRISVQFASDVCCASVFLSHVGIQNRGGYPILTEISQGAENKQMFVKQTMLNKRSTHFWQNYRWGWS